ncbi:helix-turn-helix transcriptional regulator [Embleya sp. NPDC005575]|uniref:helix-turn-helix transcriptional regulator n=1 Tax=Embleya sp. NPDC005575 TaxID=3156892 RepID=UPI0033A1F2C7
MGLSDRRKVLGYSQESFAHALGVDRTTVGRWERGETAPQPQLRPKAAKLLQVDLAGLDALVIPLQAGSERPTGSPAGDRPGLESIEDMIRRDFLRAIAVTSALVGLPVQNAEALTEVAQRGRTTDFLQMNDHLWQVYLRARAKGSVRPIVRDQLSTLNSSLDGGSTAELQGLCGAAGDLFQLAGELAFDGDRYADAAASYTLAAVASREAGSFDLWACALVRHAYVELYQHRYGQAARTLSGAEQVARRGDSSLSTRHWVACVQAEAYAGLGEMAACERALDNAEQVAELDGPGHNGGWLRFDGSRLAEERGARYVQLGHLDRAENVLVGALAQGALAPGQSFRRRAAVLTDLAAIGAKRRDPDQVVTYGREALQLARESSSGYVARRLQGLLGEFGQPAHDGRIADLQAEIIALNMA